MKDSFLSRYTPSLMKSEDLEALFVQREALARRIIELIRDSALTASKHHTLLVGPRGIGKTHLVALIYHRVKSMADLRDQLLIAWLREDEWGVTSFLDLLLRIFRALRSEYGDAVPVELIESIYKLSADVAERRVAGLLTDFVGNRSLLIIAENLEDLFDGLAEEGQKQLRAYLQENPFCTILATAQSLFNGVSLQTSPFYGFFRINHLDELTFDDATRLLANIANFEGDRQLASFIQTPMGRARVRAVHHLAAGNHRVYVIFSQFLNRESLDELVEPLIRTLDDLTPYYQARMAWLSRQQRKVIEFLCDRRHAVPVKDIAQRCFMTHQVTSAQLKDLREKGYVDSTSVGRESYYELREPLMRLCIEVKKHRGEPIRLLVDFLRLWYSRQELERRLEQLQVSLPIEREYLLHALRTTDGEKEDHLTAACLRDYDAYVKAGDFGHALEVTEELAAIRSNAIDWVRHGLCLGNLKRSDEALAAFYKAIELNPKEWRAWNSVGIALGDLGRHDEALAAFDKAIECNSKEWRAWNGRGVGLSRLGRHDEALAAFDKAIELNPKESLVWTNRGVSLGKLGRIQEALVSFGKITELNPRQAESWLHRGMALDDLGRHDEALAAFDKAIELNPKDSSAWGSRGVGLGRLGRHDEALAAFDKAIECDPEEWRGWTSRGMALGSLGRHDEALAAFDKAIELNPKDSSTWTSRGMALGSLGRHDEALAAFDKMIEVNPKDGHAWFHRGMVLDDLGRHDEALAAFDKAIELNPKDSSAWGNRGVALGRLGRHDEALAAFDKAIECDPEEWRGWTSRGMTLGSLGRHDEALAAFDKAIGLGERALSVFFGRAEAHLALNHWKEASLALDDALSHRAHDDEHVAFHTSVIVRTLLAHAQEATTWRTLLKMILDLYDRHRVSSALGQGLVRNIPFLTSQQVSNSKARGWLEVWQELAGERKEFETPLRLLDAAVRYRETQDRRVLLELPLEERKLLEPLLGAEEPQSRGVGAPPSRKTPRSRSQSRGGRRRKAS